MKLSPSNRVLAVLFIVILALSFMNTYLIVYYNDTLQKQHNQDVSDINYLNAALNQTNAALNQTNAALNQTNNNLNQTYTSLNQTDYVIQDLLNGKIDNLDARLPIQQYDYVIYSYWNYQNNESVYVAKNGKTGLVDFNSTDAASVFNNALANGNNVYVISDQYNLASNINMANKKNARLDSDGATLILNGNKIVVAGSDYEHSQNNQVSGFIIVNGTVRIQNSFQTTVTNMIFENCTVGLELANTNTWTEGTRIDTVHFEDCVQGIVFRTNASSLSLQENSTGSYANTEISRCYFNQLDNSVAITVEPKAELTDSVLQNVRVWIGEFGDFNQTGLVLDGSMYQTQMSGVVFESFATSFLDNASLYAVKIGDTAYQTPMFGSGVNILGNWTGRIDNSDYKWIYGVGGVFEQTNITIPVGTINYGKVQVIQLHPATIADFNSKIAVQGSFVNNETVTVNISLEFIDNVRSTGVLKSFNSSGSVWLNNDDFLHLYTYPDVIYAILIEAKASTAMSNVTVTVDLYGTTT